MTKKYSIILAVALMISAICSVAVITSATDKEGDISSDNNSVAYYKVGDSYVCDITEGDSYDFGPFYIGGDPRYVVVDFGIYETEKPRLVIPYVVFDEQLFGKSFEGATIDEVLESCAKKEKVYNEYFSATYEMEVILVFENFEREKGEGYPEGHFLYNKYYKNGELHDLDKLLSGEVEWPEYYVDEDFSLPKFEIDSSISVVPSFEIKFE